MQPERVILFIHGAGGGAWEWRDWLPLFSGGWRVLAPDLQPVSAGPAATRLDDYADQCLALLQRPRDAPAPVLVGASMGGLLALRIAELIVPAALILVNSVPPAGTPGWPRRRRRFPAVLPWSRVSTLEGTRASMPDADEGTVRWAHANWRDESGAVMQALYAGVPVRTPTAPVLMMIGAEDDEVPPALGLALGERLGADVMLFRGVSHVGALLGARAPTLARLARAWLEGVP